MPTEPKHTATALENLIDSAEQSVKVYLYVFSTGWAANPLARALVDAAERGVVVQLMFDARFYADFWPEGGGIDFSDRLVELKDVEGVFIKLINFGEWSAAHPKMVVVDGERAYVGSANWTSSSLVERREVGVIFEDRVLASALDEIFRTDWNSGYTRWVVEPNWLFGIVLTTGAIFGVLVMVLFATVHARRRKKKRERRKWIAELWASPRQEV
jgi:phosphatidylserine/phosphatidylglycerophosphate/cardiolipin synthase-like enzyme